MESLAVTKEPTLAMDVSFSGLRRREEGREGGFLKKGVLGSSPVEEHSHGNPETHSPAQTQHTPQTRLSVTLPGSLLVTEGPPREALRCR